MNSAWCMMFKMSEVNLQMMLKSQTAKFETIALF